MQRVLTVQTHNVPPSEQGSRIDRLLRRLYPSVSYVALQKALRRGWIRLEHTIVHPSTQVKTGQQISLSKKWLENLPPSVENTHDLPSRWHHRIDTWIVYEDADFLVLNKPIGIASQGGTGQTISMDDLVRRWGRERGDTKGAHGTLLRLTHRLDKETSGVLVFAKTLACTQAMGKAFQTRNVTKQYWGLVWGKIPDRGRIQCPLKKVLTRMVPDPNGLPALTTYRRLACYYVGPQKTPLSWVILSPKTGRTHQLRAHLQHLGYPLLGDPWYGHGNETPPGMPKISSLHLHCHTLTVFYKAREISFTAPIPDPFQTLLAYLQEKAILSSDNDKTDNP